MNLQRSLKTFTIIFIFISFSTSNYWNFDGNGLNQLLSMSRIEKEFTDQRNTFEDQALTSSLVLGLSIGQLNNTDQSSFIADLMLLNSFKTHIDYMKQPDNFFRERFIDSIFQTFKDYNATIDTVLENAYKNPFKYFNNGSNNISQTYGRQEFFKSKDPAIVKLALSSYVNYTGVSIATSENNTVGLNIVQIGNNSLTIFEKVYKDNSFYYIPRTITDNRANINPSDFFKTTSMAHNIQIQMKQHFKLDVDLEFAEEKAKAELADVISTTQLSCNENNILLIGSESFYNTVSPSLMTIGLNYLIYKLNENQDLSIDELAFDLAFQYTEYIKSKQDALIQEYNNINMKSKIKQNKTEDELKRLNYNNSVTQRFNSYKAEIEQANKKKNKISSINFSLLTKKTSQIPQKIQIDRVNETGFLPLDSSDQLESKIIQDGDLNISGLTASYDDNNLFSGCSAKSLIATPETPKHFLNSFTLNDCVIDVLERLKVESHSLHEIGFNKLSKFLVLVGRRIQNDRSLLTTPYFYKRLDEGKIRQKVPKEDLTVITTGIAMLSKAGSVNDEKKINSLLASTKERGLNQIAALLKSDRFK